MPLKLYPPRPGKTPNWQIRGTLHGVRVDESSGTPVEAKARKVRARIEAEIERGAFQKPGEKTFADAVEAYLDAGGDDRFLGPLTLHFGEKACRLIDQDAIDKAAKALYPSATPATRNRQVYTPTLAILKRAGFRPIVQRPAGAQGETKVHFQKPEQLERLLAAAHDEDPELALLFLTLGFTGLRITECLRIRKGEVWLAESFLFCGKTKNGEPRAVHLPPLLVDALRPHLEGKDDADRVFRFTKNKWLYARAHRAYKAAKVDHGGQPFHIQRHTFGAWMKRAGADLVGTGAWKSQTAAKRYEGVIPSEEAQKADRLPNIVIGGKAVE